MDTDKTKKTKAPAQTPTKSAAKAPAKPTAKPAAKPATKPAAKPLAMKQAKPAGRQEMLLARVEAVRLSQREGGYFDCFGRAVNGYCDQGACTFHAECLSVSQQVHAL